MLRTRLAVVGFLAVLTTAGACTQATTKADVCEQRWSENSDTAVPHDLQDDPVAVQDYHDRYVSICNR